MLLQIRFTRTKHESILYDDQETKDSCSALIKIICLNTTHSKRFDVAEIVMNTLQNIEWKDPGNIPLADHVNLYHNGFKQIRTSKCSNTESCKPRVYSQSHIFLQSLTTFKI